MGSAQVIKFPDRSAPTFEWWAANRRLLAPKTIKDYGSWIRNAERWFINRDQTLGAASAQQLLKYFDSLRPTYSLRKNVRYSLIAYFDFVIAVELRTDNPARALPRSKPPKRLPKPIPTSQVPALIAEAQRHKRPELGCMVVIYLHTGLRLTELITRRWTDLVDKHLYIVAKGGGERCVFLNAPAAEALAAWRAKCPESVWLFPSPRDPSRHISGSWVYSKIRDFGDAVGIEGCRPHRLRHTFATSLYAQTRDLLVVKEALGHVDVKNTMVYTQAHLFGVQEALETFAYR